MQQLKPFLINLVGLKSLQNFDPKHECESLVYENNEKSLNISEVNNEYLRENRELFSILQHRLDPVHTVNNFMSRDFSPASVADFPDIMDEHPNIENISDTVKRRLNRVYKMHQYSSEGVNQGCFAAAVSINGQMVFKQAYRSQDVENNVPASIDMVAPIGNVTKVFTSLMIMKLIQEGRLELHTTAQEVLGNLLPKMRMEKDLMVEWPTHNITIEQLLQHSSGVKSETNTAEMSEDFVDSNTRNRPDYGLSSFDALLPFIFLHGLEFVPGHKSRESNYGYQLLAAVYEKVTGHDFIEDVRDQLVKMGLYDTDFIEKHHLGLDAKKPKYECVQPFNSGDGIIGSKGSEHGFGYGLACYGMCSTLDDLVKFGNILAQCVNNYDNLCLEPLQQQMANTILTQPTLDARLHRISEHSSATDIIEDCFVLGWNAFRFYDGYPNMPLRMSLNSRPQILALYKSTRRKEGEAGLMILFDRSDGPIEGNPNLFKQIRPTVYPLGEAVADPDGDVIVGAIFCDSRVSGSVEEFIFDIMQTLYLEYKKHCLLY